jgi:LmbE family N-acetylglucosaminyl deacetylase
MSRNLRGIYLLPSLSKIHQMVMFLTERSSAFALTRLRNRLPIMLFTLLILGAATFLAVGQPPEHPAIDHTSDRPADHPADHYYEPLPQDTGATGLKLMLRRLQTTGRLMQVDAHPDDEDGGMLTLEARGKGVSTLLMTLNRGEGGQNKLGSNLFDVLGVVRTLEVLAADRYYGVEQRFSRVADFGYSKTPEETFQKWQGHDIALADIVRVVRTFRPDVLIARFSGTDRDGHGHHQASAILTKEAFRAAADPNRFPEQIKEGLQPWQPKKLYIGNVCGFGASSCDAGDYTVKLNTGKEDPLLGESYVQFAIEGLRHQQSQALGGVSVPKGDRFAYYKLVDSVVESPKDKDGHERDFFDGIDTSLMSRLGEQGKKIPWLRKTFEEIQRNIDEAEKAADPAAVERALDAADALTSPLTAIAGLPSPEDIERIFYLDSLLSEIQHARALLAAARLQAVVDGPAGGSTESAFMAVPGEQFEVTTKLSVPAGIDKNASIGLRLPSGWRSEELNRRQSNNELTISFRVHVPLQAEITRPYWHRHDPERDALNTIDEPQYQTLPLPPPPVQAVALFGKGQTMETVCMVRYKDASGNLAERPVAVAPAYSVGLSPSSAVFPIDLHGGTSVKSSVRDQGNGSEAQIVLRVPDGWQADPSRETLKIAKDQLKDVTFRVEPTDLKEEHTHIFAELTSGNRKYDEGYTVVTREDLGTFYYYQPAIQSVSIVDVKVPKDLKLGYIMGAGDDIPTVLEQLGMNVTMIPADRLASEDLSKYQTIVLGIRAYDTQKGVIDNNKRLLDFVANGGRLVVQYNTLGSFGVPIDFNSGKYTPYPATLGRARVSVEEAPIVILDPSNPIFHSPNEITQKDFDGWVQERGLYFMTQWDSNFTPLLESHDPGEPEQKGGLLVAHYGKGTYIYTGYAFFRQLPAGVPGAVRLFVNLISSR